MGDRSLRSNDLLGRAGNFFEPKSVAVIGASSNPSKVGHAILRNILDSGYKGRVFPVNPHSKEILGVKAQASVSEIPVPVDLCVIVIPARAVPGVLDECGSLGVPFCVVISAGFKETGFEGLKLEREIIEIARKHGMRVLGPNCLGFINTNLPINASFSRIMPPTGKVGMISQSGAICTSLIDWARSSSCGFSKLISLGNSCDLTESDFVEMLAVDKDTRVISLYVEGVVDGRRFMEALSFAAEKKPVIVYKSGKTLAGAKAASSHTGSLAGSQAAYQAACERSGAIMVDSLAELFDLSRAFALMDPPKGNKIAILTNAGGPGIITADACEKAGLYLAGLERKTINRLKQVLPPAAGLHNPVDVLGDAGAQRYTEALEALVSDEGVDALLLILTPQAMTDAVGTARGVVNVFSSTDKPIICSFMGRDSLSEAVNVLQNGGVLNIDYPDHAADILGGMYARTVLTKRPVSVPPRYSVDFERVRAVILQCIEKGMTQLDLESCVEILGAYGVPTAAYHLSESAEEAVEFAEAIGYPVAMKIVSPQVLHKTDIGGVVLDISSSEKVEQTFEQLISRTRRHMPDAEILGVAVQKMVPRGREIIVGMTRDPQFGPLLMVGFGGIYVEAFKDTSFRIAPVSFTEAASMLRELKAFSLLEGIRGEKRADIESVEDVVLRVSQLACDHPEILEMDINPLMVYNAGDGCVCVDVRMTIGR